jgi:hypothetical protein
MFLWARHPCRGSIRRVSLFERNPCVTQQTVCVSGFASHPWVLQEYLAHKKQRPPKTLQ